MIRFGRLSGDPIPYVMAHAAASFVAKTFENYEAFS
jgi:hypothetical protein